MHSQKTRPGIIGTAVTEPGDEAQNQRDEVGVFGVDGLGPSGWFGGMCVGGGRRVVSFDVFDVAHFAIWTPYW